VQALGDLPGITVTGAVDDVRPYVAAAKVYVVPVRVGGGTRLKLLQAMAMGCAIVSTSVGAEGVQVEHGRHLLIADAPQQFAQAVLSLLSDEARRQSLGMAARRLVTTRYTWQKLLPTLDAIYPPD
jgi:glycosyltransferase involved in cell wall biosynthesis